jgi:hypothetical protein
MKLIIWWLGLMNILPLLYLFWWKKRWRLLFGIIILVVLAISYLAPSEFANSILTRETEKEKPLEQLNIILERITDYEPNPDDSEKVKLEKLMAKAKKEIKEANRKKAKGEKLSQEETKKTLGEVFFLLEKQREWISKWRKKEKVSTLLFCGEEFNEELVREKKSGEYRLRSVENYNIIDFGQTENKDLDSFWKKIQAICQQKENDSEKINGNFPIVWFKNIDKITDENLKEKLAKVIDPNQNNNLGKYQVEMKLEGKTEQVEKTIDLSQFALVATTSTTNPPSELKTKLKHIKHIEPFLDKYFWFLFFSSMGVEVVIFFLLVRGKRKSENRTLNHLEY